MSSAGNVSVGEIGEAGGVRIDPLVCFLAGDREFRTAFGSGNSARRARRTFQSAAACREVLV